MDKKVEIVEAKRYLLYLLLGCENKELTDIEVDIMFFLTMDNDIQLIYKRKLNNKKAIG